MNKRLIGAVAGVAGIAMLVFALFSSHWVVGQDYGIETRVGLRSIDLCQPVQQQLDGPEKMDCSSISHAEIARSPSKLDGFETFSLVAALLFYLGLVCATLQLAITVLSSTKIFLHLPVRPTTMGILVSFSTLLLVATTLAIHPWKAVGWGTGYAVLLGGTGAIACLFASITLGRIQPPDEDWA